MQFYRYRRWDGTQDVGSFTPDDLMEHIADDMLEDGDLSTALRRLLRRGAELPGGRRVMGLQELLERLRDAREQDLNRYNLGGMLDQIREQLDRILETERQGILNRLEDSDESASAGEEAPTPGEDDQQGLGEGQGASTPSRAEHADGGAVGEGTQRDGQPDSPAPALSELLQRIASNRLQQLDQLPPDVGGRIKALRDYDFMDPSARQQFEELLEMLQQQVLQNYFQGMQQGIQAMTPEAIRQTQQMVHDLNDLLQQRLHGEEPDLEEFMRKWGQYFPDGIEDVDQLVDHMQGQIAQMDSLLRSMTPEMRGQLEDMLDSVFQDGEFQNEMAELAANLERPNPTGGRGDDFQFFGDEPITLQEALKLMGGLNDMEQMERQLMQAVRSNDASQIDANEMGRILGDDARQMVEQMQQMMKMLEESGFIRPRGREWELTPKAVRKLGERALQDIFSRLDRGHFGDHSMERRGFGIEPMEETKRYVFGDPLTLDVEKTVMNAIFRQGAGTPVRISPEDFEVSHTRSLTRSSTVIMLDMSYSMMMDGRFQAGRKVAIALDRLIRSRFPKDNLYVVAFSYFVLTLKPEMLFDSYWVEYGGGTNFQEALRQARSILVKHHSENKQIVMITDGEPTTYNFLGYGDQVWDGGRGSRAGLETTLREVVKCAREGITINTFIMGARRSGSEFVRLMTRLNKGRAFYSTPDRLGEYILMDYVNNKRQVVR